MITHGNTIEVLAGNSNKPLAEAIAKNATLEELPLKEYQKYSPLFRILPVYETSERKR